MIRTLVVDDDVMAASIHRTYANRVAGFEVVGEAHTGMDAVALVRDLRPDLVLLDIYLPDINGIEVIHRLRAAGMPRVDVIAITAAKDVETLRATMQGGVVHYLVKPFFFDTFRARLESYAALNERLGRLREAQQEDVDHLFSLLRAQGQTQLPKGISAPTLSLVVEAVRRADGELSAAEVADAAGVSRGTARRYLEYLAMVGSLELSLRYGAAGRPEHLYRWTGAVGASTE
jgi:response regulator of citrate/malate metabolism